MTQIQRNAAIDALSDILLARAASRHKGGSGGMSGMSGTIKVDPRLNKPEPTGGGGKMPVNDPQGILNQRNKTTVAMPDVPTNTASDQSDTSPQQPINDADGNSSGTNNDTGMPNQDGGSSGAPDGASDAEKDEKSTTQDEQTNTRTQQTDSNAPSADYRNAWNNIITRFDRDDISKDQLLELIAKIQNGELEI